MSFLPHTDYGMITLLTQDPIGCVDKTRLARKLGKVELALWRPTLLEESF